MSGGGGGESTTLDPALSDFTFAIYRADAETNTIQNFAQTFTVDVGANTITPAVNPSFAIGTYPPFNGSAGAGGVAAGVSVTFTSTGTLPAPLVAGTKYYLAPTGGGAYRIHVAATEADIGVALQTALPKENVLYAQRLYENLFPIVLTDAGSGTHTVTSATTVSVLKDLKDGLYNMKQQQANAGRHGQLEKRIDDDGDVFLWSGGDALKVDYSGNSQTPFGNSLDMVSNKTTARAALPGKRSIAHIFVCKIRKSNGHQACKYVSDASRVNTTTNVITINLSISEDSSLTSLTASALVRLRPMIGATLPSGITADADYYVRKGTGTNITLHPTATDATNNTNVVDITSTGSGGFIIYAPALGGSLQRGNFLIEWIDTKNSGNVLSPRLSYGDKNYDMSNIITSGGSNGNFNSFTQLTNDRLTGDDIQFKTYIASVLPTGLSENTTYYVRRQSEESGTCTIHPTLSDATNNTNKITFSTAASGIVHVVRGDDKFDMALGAYEGDEADDMGLRIDFDKKMILCMKIDYNPSLYASPDGWIGVNNPRSKRKTLIGYKGLLPALTGTNTATANPYTIFNSLDGHRPIDMDYYEHVMLLSEEDIDYNTLAKMINYLGQQYTVPDFVPVELLTYSAPSAPTILSCVAGNAKITVDITPGFDGNVSLTDFTAYYRIVGSGSAYTKFTDSVGTGTRIVINSGVSNGTAYEVVVTQTNTLGESPISSPSSPVTPSLPIASPDVISGLNLWLDASDTGTITHSSGNVSAITDKSSAGNNPASIVAVTGTRTLNSLNVLDFNGTTAQIFHAAALLGIGTSNYTAFFVFASDVAGGASNARTLLHGTIAAGSARVFANWNSSLNRVRFAHNPNSGPVADGTIAPDTSAHIVMVRRNGTELSIGFDGLIIETEASVGGNVTITALATGCHAFSGADRFDGIIAETPWYNRAITNLEASQVVTYLQDKWGLI
jgi:hypothetical protein